MTATRRAATVLLVLLAAIAIVAITPPLQATAQPMTTIPGAEPTPSGPTVDAADLWFEGDGLDSSGYDIGYQPPGWNDLTAKVGGFWLEIEYGIVKLLTSAAVATLTWGFEGRIGDMVAGIVDPTATRFHMALFGSDRGLYDFALFIAVAIASMMALRGRLSQAAGELILTWLVGVLYLATFAGSPGGFAGLVDGMQTTANNLSVLVVEAAMGSPGSCDGVTEAASVMCPTRAGFHTAFVAGPYDQLNWGQDLGAAGDASNPLAACAAARDDLVATGPWETDDRPRTAMTAAGCDAQANYQAAVTAERVLLGLVIAIVSGAMVLVVALIGLGLSILQMLMAISVMVLPFAVLGGLIPGAPRAMLWRWIGWASKLVAGVVAVALLLAIYLVVITETLTVTQGLGMGLRFMALLIPTLTLVWARRRMLKASKTLGGTVGTTLDRVTPGRAAGGTVGQATTAFSAPQYRGVRPGAYANPNARAIARDVRHAKAKVSQVRARRRAAKTLRAAT